MQQERNAITVKEQDITQPFAGALNKEKTIITGPPAGPTTGNPATTDITVNPQADTGSPDTEATVTVLTTLKIISPHKKEQEEPHTKISSGQSYYTQYSIKPRR